jgi:hypothetical protein
VITDETKDFSLTPISPYKGRLHFRAPSLRDLVLEGVKIEAAYRIDDHFLLLVTMDNEWEETVFVHLLTHDGKLCNTKKLGWGYTPGYLSGQRACEDAIEFAFPGPERRWRVCLAKNRLWQLLPWCSQYRLKLSEGQF